MTADRCTGHCCQNFSLTWSPQALREGYQRWLALRDGGSTISKSGASLYPFPIDIHLIAPMVQYLGDDAPDPECINSEPSITDVQLSADGNELLVAPTFRYRCKHWDTESGDCTIYDIRPQMCRDYPGEAGCNYAACTWRSRRQTPR